MNLRLYTLALIAALLVLAGFTESLAQGTRKIWFTKSDTTWISFDGATSDSNRIKGTLDGQLTDWSFRNNDYGSTDGIKIQTLSPDGDSTLAGIWMLGDSKVYLVVGHQSKLISSALGTSLYGNYILNPTTGATYPFFILKNSSNDSTWLTMAANGLPQWSRATNLPNSWPVSPATGDFGRSGDVLRFRSSGGTYGFDFGTAPSVGMGWRWNGTTWAPGYPDTGAVGGGGSSVWSALTAPTGNLSINMSDKWTQFIYGDIGSVDAFSITDNASSTGAYLFNVITDPVNSLRKPFAAMGSLNKGIEVTNAGVLQAINGGQVNATQYNGSATVGKVYLDGATVFNDQSNTYSGNYTQSFTSFGSSPIMTIQQNGSGVGLTVNATNNGVEANSTSGIGIAAYSGTTFAGWFKGPTSGTSARFISGTDTAINIGSTGINPGVTSTKTLGTSALKFRAAHGDTLYAYASVTPGTDNTGKIGSSTKQFDSLFVTSIYGKQYGSATLGVGDSVTVYVKGAISTWIAQPYFKGGQLSDGGLTGYFTTDSLHIIADLTQPTSSLAITYSAERIDP